MADSVFPHTRSTGKRPDAGKNQASNVGENIPAARCGAIVESAVWILHKPGQAACR